MVFNLLFPSA